MFATLGRESPLLLCDYLTDLAARARVIAAWERFFDEWDVLLCPVTNRTAFEHRPMERPYEVDGQLVEYWTIGRHTGPFNLIGAPAVSVPVARDSPGLPIGIQLVGKRWKDETVLTVAGAVEALTGVFPSPPAFVG